MYKALGLLNYFVSFFKSYIEYKRYKMKMSGHKFIKDKNLHELQKFA